LGEGFTFLQNGNYSWNNSDFFPFNVGFGLLFVMPSSSVTSAKSI